MTPLSDAEIRTALASLPGWMLEQGALSQTFEFADFLGSMAFVNHVALDAEAHGHHPDIDIRWNKVKLTLATHDVGGITRKDVDLAASIQRLKEQ